MKKLKLIVFIIIVLAGLSFAILYFITYNQKEKIAELENKIELLKEESVPVRFKIIEKDSIKMKVALKLYDLDNNVIQKTEYDLQGSELSLDFIVIQVKDRYIAFPDKIFTDKIAAKDGISLIQLYDVNGFPQVFYSQSGDKELAEAIKMLFKTVKTGDTESIKNSFGNMVHDINDIKSFKPKFVYKVVVHTKGGIEIIEE